MDKYEFNLKIEQLKKLVEEEDYYTALKITDGIEWERVRNINLLTMAATVYEKNDRLEDAIQLLEEAFKRAPSGKRILFKLTELSVKTGNIREAEDYYYEYRQTDPTDINIYLLQYMILKARHAPYDRQLEPLELYAKEETDERWLYELAVCYDFAGRKADCVKTCDRIAVMFGGSRYGLKALRLKMRYATLTDAQKNILYPRSASGDFADYGGERTFEDYGYYREPDPLTAGVVRQDAVEEYEDTVRKEREAKKNSDTLAAMRYEDEDDAFSKYLVSSGLSGDTGVNSDPGSASEVVLDSNTGPLSGPGPVSDDSGGSGAGFGSHDSDGSVVRDAGPLGSTGLVSDSTSTIDTEKQNIGETSDDGNQLEFDFDSDVPAIVEGKPPEPTIEESDGENAGVQISEGRAQVPSPVPVVTPLPDMPSSAPMTPPSPGAMTPVSASVTEESPATAPSPKLMPKPQSGPEPVISTSPASKAASKSQSGSGPDEAPSAGPKLVPDPKPMTIDGSASPKKINGHHLIVEAEDEDTGLKIAVSELKRLHTIFNLDHPSIKTTAKKLKKIGFTDSIIKRIKGKDFVIEHAGSLDDDTLKEVYDFIREDTSGTTIVLVDTPPGMDKIEDTIPELFDICEYVSDIANEDDSDDGDEYEDEGPDSGAYDEDSRASVRDVSNDDADGDDSDDDDTEDEYDTYGDEGEEDDWDQEEDRVGQRDDSGDRDEYEEDEEDEEDDEDEESGSGKKSKTPSLKKRSIGETAKRFSNLKNIEVDPGEEMESDDFAQYCMQYAEKIDCSISGTSMLALYERIELMEEDGIALTREVAEQLIEEAADRAEKPPIGERLKGLFHSKYDKNGCLILKESDFIY